ncbi:MAG: O-antigen ligase family protein [Fimbriimonadaceae bacterium]|nr:O-antigen ligase family protein [Fimbriimonadaceae bacterium]
MRSRQEALLLGGVGCLALSLGSLCLYLAASDLSLTYALAVVGALLALAMVLVSPQVGLYLYVASIYLRPGDRFVVLQQLRLTLLLAFLTSFVWLAQYLIRKKPPLVRHPLLPCLGGLLLAGIWSWVPASVRSSLDVGIEFGKQVILAVLVANLVRSPQRLRTFCWLLLWCSAFNALQAILGYQAGEATAGRAAGVGVIADPNDLALTLVIALPVAVALWLGERGFWRRWAAVLGIGLLLAGILVTKSRGGMVGLLLVLFLEGYERIAAPRSRRAYSLLAGWACVMALSAMLAVRGQTFDSLSSDGNVYNRRGAWVAGWRMLLDRPLTGVAMYQFASFTDAYGPPWMDQRYMTAHNSVVQVAGELGLPGLLFFLLLLRRLYQAHCRVRQGLRAGLPVTRLQQGLSLALGRSLAGWLACAMFLSQAYQVWLYLLVGLTVAVEQLLRQQALEAGP